MVNPRIAARVRNFVTRQRFGKLFSTRELLNLGPRENIDRTLSRLVKEGVIMRLANGIFMRAKHDTRIPTVGEIAAHKARVFGRKILTAGAETVHKSFGGAAPQQTVYATDGNSSSFQTIKGRVHLKKYAPRKLQLANSVVGKTIRAIWELGKDKVTDGLIRKVRHELGMHNFREFSHSCAFMPAWMAETFVFMTNRSNRGT